MGGFSIVLIIRELERRDIKSPQGKDTWSKLGIQTVLTNEKYVGHVLLGKTYDGDFPNNKQRKNHGEQEQYLKKDAHEPIIELEKFEQVQAERERRCNIEIQARAYFLTRLATFLISSMSMDTSLSSYSL